MHLEQGKMFDSLYYLNFSMDPDQLKTAVENMFRDPSCGKIFRIKGYIKGENGWLELNATSREFSETGAKRPGSADRYWRKPFKRGSSSLFRP